jgi:predicted Zn-dependent protease
MQDRILRGFEAAAASHPGFVRMTECQAAGNLADAAQAVIEVIRQFPNYAEGYKTLARICEAAAIDASAFKASVAKTLTQAIEDQFLYRYELVQAAMDLASKVERRQ